MAESLATVSANYSTNVNKASTPGNVGIAGGGPVNNADTGVLIQSGSHVLEAGVASLISLWEADGVVVGGGGRGCLHCPGGRSCRKCKAGMYGGGGGGGGASLPLLVTNVSSSNTVSKTNDNSSSDKSKEWSRQQKRGFQRVKSLLQYWQSNGFQVLWVCLTTADGGDRSKLAYHHQKLRQRVERKLGYGGLQHFQVRTSEGNGVLHVFWAWRAQNGFRGKAMWVSQQWLSGQWQDIHGASVVWVSRVKGGRKAVNKVSKYAITQYVSGQAGYEYMSWSWGRTFGFPLVAFWRAYKRLWSRWHGQGNRSGMYSWWSHILAGRSLIPLPLSLVTVAQGYKDYGKEFWTFFR